MKKKIFNVPNILTLIRIFLIPVMMVFLLVPYFTLKTFNYGLNLGYLVALGIFLLASFTDFLDGYIARKKNLITDFGKLLDPIADKLLVFAALVVFVEKGVVASWVVVVMLAREFLVTGFRLIAAGKRAVIAANLSGKIKTAFSMVALIFFFLNGFPLSLVSSFAGKLFLDILAYLMVLLTVISGIEFFIKNSKVLFKPEEEEE